MRVRAASAARMPITESLPVSTSTIGSADLGRLAAGRAGHAHHPTDGLDEEVVTRRARARPVAEAGDRAVDDLRVDRGHAVVVEAVAREVAGAEVLHEHVGPPGQFDGPGQVGLDGEVQRDAVLAPVEGFVVRGRAGRPRRPPGPALVADARPLHLDDGRAEVGEGHRGERAGQHPAEVGHQQTVESRRDMELPTSGGLTIATQSY